MKIDLKADSFVSVNWPKPFDHWKTQDYLIYLAEDAQGSNRWLGCENGCTLQRGG